MTQEFFTWTPARYAMLALLVLPFFVGMFGVTMWARRKPQLQGYPVIVGITFLMMPFIIMFAGLHAFWPEGFKELPEFIHIFYDRTLYMQRDHLVSFLSHSLTGTAMWFMWLVLFHPRARVRYPRLHHWTGRLYFLLMLPLCGTALHVMMHTPADAVIWRTLIISQVVLALFTSAMALRAILKGQTIEHHRWVVRNVSILSVVFFMRVYLMALTFFTQDIGSILNASTALAFITTFVFFGWYFEPRYIASVQRNLERDRKPTLPKAS